MEQRQLERSLFFLHQGELVAFNTDTIPGVAALAPRDMGKLYALKNREESKRLVWMAGSMEQVAEWVRITELGVGLAKRFWPGALTLVFDVLPGKIFAIKEMGLFVGEEQTTLAFRIPKNDFLLELLNRVGSPLAVTSINPSGAAAFCSLAAAEAHFGEAIAFYCENEAMQAGGVSTVVDVRGDRGVILRQGAIFL